MEFENADAMLEYCKTTGRTYVAFNLVQTTREIGSVVLELYTDIAPATCANFLRLIKAGGQHTYENSPIHRVVKTGWIQGGDVVDGSGKGDPGFTLPDETFAVKHDDKGILGMANKGQPHTAASQFYITLSPLPFLDGKRVAFGKVLTLEGLECIAKLENLQTYINERPVPDVLITNCRVLYEP
ncbi:hypothetical protein VOLCADRAFT_75661 [Volvox carteri f. nagariensis]|uniref:Peptidyl-prolyl cis-trans isomerase n=1 Tax=Volvox carteri f. nagariensis TaxID=3068 RepID=D8U3Q5_VOLCA|nr:uncharacterized protein VOLCADRAFT_75661 [Volvox carteri f. nagariensis]EFJ45651.1 hypothetical protein VOLCADRAFT_75661 [Volvox carteri f. nagariensis]|eukprot:XP_002953341.1 hypothetical protein VOLCADRAFT_75661 [Volvox carteri f. nagariensis]